ncbi:MAG: aldo/keto reductase [Actinobacteria bacterium]|nr:aldo/keto reductase [Actinomycetota bacterium]
MEKRRLGRTGHESSLVILGGAAFAACSTGEAETAFYEALEMGVNHLDIAPRYGDAEKIVGPCIPSVRKNLFVGCKTAEITADAVRSDLETSLTRLGCDYLNLYQAHGVTDLEDLDNRADALETIIKIKEEGITQYAGITGHDVGAPRAHLEALKRYDLDTVMFPIYPRLWSDQTYREDAEKLLSYCEKNDVGVQIIKSIAREPWGANIPSHRCWYKPETEERLIDQGVRFALSTPGVTAIASVGDLMLLPSVLKAAENFSPMNENERRKAIEQSSDNQIIFPISEHFRRD